MSFLQPDSRSSRSRSKSPGRTRSRSRSDAGRDKSPAPSAYSYGEVSHAPLVPAPEAYGGSDNGNYEIRSPTQESPALSGYPPQPNGHGDDHITMGDFSDFPPHERPGYVPPQQQGQMPPYPGYDGPISPGAISMPGLDPGEQQSWGYTPHAVNSARPSQPVRNPSESSAGTYQYATLPQGIKYTAKPVTATTQPAYKVKDPKKEAKKASRHGSYSDYPPPPPGPPPLGGPYGMPSGMPGGYDGPNIEVRSPTGSYPPPPPPSNNYPPPPPMRPHSLSVNDGSGRHAELRAPSPSGLDRRMNRLSVSGDRPDMHGMTSGGLPPPSPMMEPYRGVYQQISPMPGALRMSEDDLMDLPPLDSRDSKGGGRHRSNSSISFSSTSKLSSKSKKSKSSSSRASRDDASSMYTDTTSASKKRARIYDAEEDAHALMDALAPSKPDASIIIDILPALTHDQMLELRNEYKKHCKVQGRGINIAKHIKLKYPSSSNFGKIAYVTALGRWESEGYWANYWYNSGNSKRELLIEALMGRTNAEIREINDSFKDKRYNDDLIRCMDKELKADKFRKAVLMALEADRQEETDNWPMEYRNRDVDTLYRALNSREGGESAMLEVVIRRSDNHLREVLRTYERKYGQGFAREALRKSNNLVGEVIAHILNGVINKPQRDALLLHHALEDIQDDTHSESAVSSKHERQQRYELLTSRLVRLHWDRMHLTRVKIEYAEKHGMELEDMIEDSTKGDYRDFCIALCDTGR